MGASKWLDVLALSYWKRVYEMERDQLLETGKRDLRMPGEEVDILDETNKVMVYDCIGHVQR